MPRLSSQIDLKSPSVRENYEAMCARISTLHKHLQDSQNQGPAAYLEKHSARGKLLPRERVDLMLDRGSPFLELMPIAGLGQKEMTLGGSLIVGIGEVRGRPCLIHANVATMKGGALNQVTLHKSMRADAIAFENRLPMIYLTESAGADLPQQSLIFNYGGAIFRDITRRSKAGIPSISVVFGSCTAGGAYIPGMSDYVIMVKNQARAYLAGPPLVKMAINEDVDDEALGGADMHSRKSGFSDYLAEDERDAIRQARDIVAQLALEEQWHRGSPRAPLPFESPRYNEEELLGLPSVHGKKSFDVRDVLARICDGSEFSEFKPLYGETLVTGWATICGYPVGILANNGVLFSEAANKGAQFIQLCQKRGVPLLYLQNITGFMVGKDAEREGIIKNGAKLINAVSNSELPAITVIIGSSYGAGNYGMCGRAFQPRFLFAWPNAKLAVMGPDQLVGVLDILERQKAPGGEGRSAEELQKAQMKKDFLRQQIEAESDAFFASSRLWDDGVIDPRDTRNVVGLCLAVIAPTLQGPPANSGFGVFRM